MAVPDPTETHRLFQHDRVAAGYASARPYLHPEVFAVVRDVVRPAARFRRALDVGCGTGLSSVALLDLVQEVVGIDAAVDMLRYARRADGVRYVAAGAEAPPFRPGTFDLVVACGFQEKYPRPRASDPMITADEAEDRARAWLESELFLLFGDESRPVAFSGYVQALPRR